MKIMIRENKSAYTDESVRHAVRLAAREFLNDTKSPLIVNVSYARLAERVEVVGRALNIWLAPEGEWTEDFAKSLRWAMCAMNGSSRGVLQRLYHAPPPEWTDDIKLVHRVKKEPPTRELALLAKIEHARVMRDQWAKAERTARRLHEKWHKEHARLVKQSEKQFVESVKSKCVQLDFAEADAAFEAAT